MPAAERRQDLSGVKEFRPADGFSKHDGDGRNPEVGGDPGGHCGYLFIYLLEREEKRKVEQRGKKWDPSSVYRDVQEFLPGLSAASTSGAEKEAPLSWAAGTWLKFPRGLFLLTHYKTLLGRKSGLQEPNCLCFVTKSRMTWRTSLTGLLCSLFPPQPPTCRGRRCLYGLSVPLAEMRPPN